MLMPLLTRLLAVLLEETTRKNSSNSSIPPSLVDKDDTGQRPKPRRKAHPANERGDSTLRTVTTEEVLTVTNCDSCGVDLSGVAPSDREIRVRYDIVFEVVEHHVEAEVKHYTDCRVRCKAEFPASLPGPRQYGSGLQAFICNLPVAQMLALRRTVELVRANSGLRLSEGTCTDSTIRSHPISAGSAC